MEYRQTILQRTYVFDDLRMLLAKASPYRSGDHLAGICANSYEERVAAQLCLADVPLAQFLQELVIPYEQDEISRLIIDSHDALAFAPLQSFSVGMLRDWLLSEDADTEKLTSIARGLTPEMVAAVSKLMRNQDLMLVARKCAVITKFRNTIGLPGRLSTRLQPNHPTDDPRGIAASIVDGLMYGSGDAVIGINPATEDPEQISVLLKMLDALIKRFEIPTQACVLAHVTQTLKLMEAGAPVDLVFQSIGGTEKTNASFGVSLSLLHEAHAAARESGRAMNGGQYMYFETGQGSALSADAAFGVDQQTCEARAYAVARHFDPFLVNSVVGFIGPEYLYDGKQITRAALEDHFCGKLLGLPMGMDCCYTNHAEADADDMDNLLLLMGASGCSFIICVPGSDDSMLHYQSASFHDALAVRKLLGLSMAPEFESWLQRQGLMDHKAELLRASDSHPLLQYNW